jgi:UDP-N-acetylglucosamine diphosphorylase/glucosamine-1-phosphate N-acetyltransferase
VQLIVFEDHGFRNLLPLVYSRATFNLRIGFDNLLAKIEASQHRTADALFVRKTLATVMAERQTRRVNQPSTCDDQLWINGRLLLRQTLDLPPQSAIWQGDSVLAVRVNRAQGAQLLPELLLKPESVRSILSAHRSVELPSGAGLLIDYPWQLVHENAAEIVRQAKEKEFNLAGRVFPGSHLINDHPIHVGIGSKIKPGAVLDAEKGPIYIGDNVTVGPASVIEGPCYIGDGCLIKPGAHIAGSSIGMVCKVGGEIEGTIFHGYSNKQHDGFLGHSYVGEWVNLGADTVGSDLKNTYGPVKVPINGSLVDSGQQFVGAFIGDHTKTAIRTALPTGCVIGYACNILTSRIAPQFVPSFTWLGDDPGAPGQPHDPVKALEVAKKVVARRNRTYSAAECALFSSIAEDAKKYEMPGLPASNPKSKI